MTTCKRHSETTYNILGHRLKNAELHSMIGSTEVFNSLFEVFRGLGKSSKERGRRNDYGSSDRSGGRQNGSSDERRLSGKGSRRTGGSERRNGGSRSGSDERH
jgi:hypothetical protein